MRPNLEAHLLYHAPGQSKDFVSANNFYVRGYEAVLLLEVKVLANSKAAARKSERQRYSL